jgi:hypothetical protein
MDPKTGPRTGPQVAPFSGPRRPKTPPPEPQIWLQQSPPSWRGEACPNCWGSPPLAPNRAQNPVIGKGPLFAALRLLDGRALCFQTNGGATRRRGVRNELAPQPRRRRPRANGPTAPPAGAKNKRARSPQGELRDKRRRGPPTEVKNEPCRNPRRLNGRVRNLRTTSQPAETSDG